jgi:hypothetical protein
MNLKDYRALKQREHSSYTDRNQMGKSYSNQEK